MRMRSLALAALTLLPTLLAAAWAQPASMMMDVGDAVSSGVAAGRKRFPPASPVELDGALYFTSNDGIHGSELWRTDGTGAGHSDALGCLPGDLHVVSGLRHSLSAQGLLARLRRPAIPAVRERRHASGDEAGLRLQVARRPRPDADGGGGGGGSSSRDTTSTAPPLGTQPRRFQGRAVGDGRHGGRHRPHRRLPRPPRARRCSAGPAAFWSSASGSRRRPSRSGPPTVRRPAPSSSRPESPA